MFLLALAAQMSLPVLESGRDLRTIFTSGDFPPYLVWAGASRIAYPRVTVRPDGTIQSCDWVFSSGDPKLDAYTCDLIVKRAKFLPAKWADGSTVYGVIKASVVWLANPLAPTAGIVEIILPDLDLFVDRLPKHISIVALKLQIEADEAGRIVSCEDAPPLDRGLPQFISIGCQQVAARLTIHPPIDASGKPVRSVQGVTVHFKIAH